MATGFGDQGLHSLFPCGRCFYGMNTPLSGFEFRFNGELRETKSIKTVLKERYE